MAWKPGAGGAADRYGDTATASPEGPRGQLLPLVTSVGVLPEHEALYRSNYLALAARPALLQELASQCGAASISLPSPGDLGVHILGRSRASTAQALSAVTCFLRYHRSGLLCRILMAPISLSAVVRTELEHLRAEGLGVHGKEGAAPSLPGQLYPVFLLALPSLPPAEAEVRLERVFRRLESLLASCAAGPPPPPPLFPTGATAVVSPWGSLQPAPSASSSSSSSTAYGAYGTPRPSNYGGFGLPSQAQPQRMVTAGRGTTIVFPSVPAPLQQSLQLLKDYFALAPARGESLLEGRDFFQAWSLALHGTVEQSLSVRQTVALALSLHRDLLAEAEEGLRASLGGGVAKDYVSMVRNDMSLCGGQLELQAAARYDDARIATFDVDTQRLVVFGPVAMPSDSARSAGGGERRSGREVALLHYQGAYWLLGPAGPVEGDQDKMATTGELDASAMATSQSQSSSSPMSEL